MDNASGGAHNLGSPYLVGGSPDRTERPFDGSLFPMEHRQALGALLHLPARDAMTLVDRMYVLRFEYNEAFETFLFRLNPPRKR